MGNYMCKNMCVCLCVYVYILSHTCILIHIYTQRNRHVCMNIYMCVYNLTQNIHICLGPYKNNNKNNEDSVIFLQLPLKTRSCHRSVRKGEFDTVVREIAFNPHRFPKAQIIPPNCWESEAQR